MRNSRPRLTCRYLAAAIKGRSAATINYASDGVQSKYNERCFESPIVVTNADEPNVQEVIMAISRKSEAEIILNHPLPTLVPGGIRVAHPRPSISLACSLAGAAQSKRFGLTRKRYHSGELR